jgi:hypothetical protein
MLQYGSCFIFLAELCSVDGQRLYIILCNGARWGCRLRVLFTTGLVLGLLLFQTFLPAVAVHEMEIAYDSGTLGGSVTLPYSSHLYTGGQEEVNMKSTWMGNSMLAVRFTPGNGTEVRKLVGVRFYVTGDLTSFNVWLFDSYRQFMIYSLKEGPMGGSAPISRVFRWTVTPASIGWVYCNVTSEEHPLLVSDDFYAAIEFTVAQKPSLGVDTGGQGSNRSWFAENQSSNGWFEYATYANQHGFPSGNLMIRIVTAPLFEATTKTTTTEGVSIGWTLPAAVGVLVVAAVGVWLLRKSRTRGGSSPALAVQTHISKASSTSLLRTKTVTVFVLRLARFVFRLRDIFWSDRAKLKVHLFVSRDRLRPGGEVVPRLLD